MPLRIELKPADKFELQLIDDGVRGYVREFRFDLTRRWRIDFAWPPVGIAVEIEGGIWVQGRHNRPSGYLKDLEKYNTLTLKGWRLLRFSPEWINDGSALDATKAMLANVDLC